MSSDLSRSNSLADLAHRINVAHEAAVKAMQQGLAHALEAGRLLIEAKQQLNAHGEWLPWLEANCTVSRRTAQAYMQVARNLGSGGEVTGDDGEEAKAQRVAHLSFREALDFLAEGSAIERASKHAVEHGDVAVSTAADIATLPVEQQQEIVARGEKEILQAAKQIRARMMEERRATRIQKLAEISTGNSSLPIGPFPVLYADPPWFFEVYDSTSGTARTPDNYYPCMATEEICAMPVRELATDDAVLFLWTTAPHLEEAFRVIEAWGFCYVSNIAWIKDQSGLGFYVRNQHELLLIATRGDIPCPLPGNRPASVIEAPRREHSRKPDEAYEIIERMYPELPKIELFARQARLGWAAWGNEIVCEAAE